MCLLEETLYEAECGGWTVAEQKLRDNFERFISKVQVEGETVAE